MPVRVVVMGDHRPVREGLRSLLDASLGIEVVGDVSDGPSAMSLAEEARPDVVIVDLTIPGVDGLGLIRSLCSSDSEIEVIALAVDRDSSAIRRALEAGASAYLPKDCVAEELVGAVVAVARGDIYLSPRVTSTVVDAYLACEARAGRRVDDTLSEQDVQILKMLASGQTAAAIGSRLGLSVKTIEAHRRAIMGKLGVDSTAGLVLYAVRSGLVELD